MTIPEISLLFLGLAGVGLAAVREALWRENCRTHGGSGVFGTI